MTDAFRSDNPILRSVGEWIADPDGAGLDAGEQVAELAGGIMETLSAIGAPVPVLRPFPRIRWTPDRFIGATIEVYGELSEHVIRMVVAGKHDDVVHALRVMLAWLATRPTVGITEMPPFDGSGDYVATVSVSFGATADAIGVFRNDAGGEMVARADLRELSDRDDVLRQLGYRRVSDWSTVDYPTATVVPV